MVTFHTVLKFLVGHILAGAVIILGTLLFTFVCYVAGLATAPHGIDTPVAVIPEFLMLMFMAGLVAVIASTGSFLISTLLTWLRTKRHFPAWLPIAVVPLVAFLIIFLIFGRTKDLAFIAAGAGGVFVYFGIYWTLLTTSAAVLDFIFRKGSRSEASSDSKP
ncbi:MAG: hypothetical protein JWQ04_1462 [Pedosphaera sp.]|nr:hypothetical protein [Pedosphaera sp.]